MPWQKSGPEIMAMTDTQFRKFVVDFVIAVRHFRHALFGMYVALLCGALVLVFIQQSRQQRTTTVDDQLKQLACGVVRYIPNETDPKKPPVIHDLRVQYHCPPAIRYQPRR